MIPLQKIPSQPSALRDPGRLEIWGAHAQFTPLFSLEPQIHSRAFAPEPILLRASPPR